MYQNFLIFFSFKVENKEESLMRAVKRVERLGKHLRAGTIDRIQMTK